MLWSLLVYTLDFNIIGPTFLLVMDSACDAAVVCTSIALNTVDETAFGMDAGKHRLCLEMS